MTDATTELGPEPQKRDYPNEFDYWEALADYHRRRADRAERELIEERLTSLASEGQWIEHSGKLIAERDELGALLLEARAYEDRRVAWPDDLRARVAKALDGKA